MTMEDKEEMLNLTRNNLTLSQILTQAQEALLLLSKHLHTLKAHMNSKKPATDKPETNNKKSINKSKNYFCNNGRTHNHNYTIPT